MKYILMDVEGTTTSISFVHDVLFPYSKERMEKYINTHFESTPVQEALLETMETVEQEERKILKHKELIDKLISWIDEDRKHSALKKLQGLIWAEGYRSGALKGHVYEDVPMMLKKWKDAGLTLGIYSSGSVVAQKDLFGFSDFGDLNQYFSNNFDTAVGHKREASSYRNILSQLNLEANDVLFLSDISQELDAAEEVGMQTIQLVRTGPVPFTGHTQVKNFAEISI
jgi:enolase-phosphatase E1